MPYHASNNYLPLHRIKPLLALACLSSTSRCVCVRSRACNSNHNALGCLKGECLFGTITCIHLTITCIHPSTLRYNHLHIPLYFSQCVYLCLNAYMSISTYALKDTHVSIHLCVNASYVSARLWGYMCSSCSYIHTLVHIYT